MTDSTDQPTTPTGRLRAILAEFQLLAPGNDVPTIRDMVAPSVPIGDVQFWMQAGLDKVIRRCLRDAGFVVNHANVDEETGAAPVATWVQLTLIEVITHTRHVFKQTDDDLAALDHRLALWCEANPAEGMTPEKIRDLAETDAA